MIKVGDIVRPIMTHNSWYLLEDKIYTVIDINSEYITIKEYPDLKFVLNRFKLARNEAFKKKLSKLLKNEI